MPAHTYYIELSDDNQDYLTSLIKEEILGTAYVGERIFLRDCWRSGSGNNKEIYRESRKAGRRK